MRVFSVIIVLLVAAAGLGIIAMMRARRPVAGAIIPMAGLIALSVSWQIAGAKLAVEDIPADCTERVASQLVPSPFTQAQPDPAPEQSATERVDPQIEPSASAPAQPDPTPQQSSADDPDMASYTGGRLDETTAIAPAKPAATDIYLALDTSPSMLLPTTSAGMQALIHATTAPEEGSRCAYACHVRKPGSTLGAYDPGGRPIYIDENGKQVTKTPDTARGIHQADSFWMAHNYGRIYGGNNIELRIDAVSRAARCIVAALRHDHPVSADQISLQAFEFGFGAPAALTWPLTPIDRIKPDSIPDLAARQPEWYSNGCLTKDNCKGFMSTDFRSMLAGLDATIPRQHGKDTGQLLVIVTDGMSDENTELDPAKPENRWIGPLTPKHLAQCAAIKHRGVRIAILYLAQTADAMKGNPWSQTNVVPQLDKIEPALARCSSTFANGKPLLKRVAVGEKIPVSLIDFTTQVLAEY